MKATRKGTRRSRKRISSTLAYKETSEDEEVGEEDAAIMVHVSAREGMAHAKPTRSNKGRLTKEPIRVIVDKVLLNQPMDHPMSNNSNLTT